MFENLFTSTCTALVGMNGRALSGDALEAAEAALTEARRNDCKIWSDRNGYVYTRKRSLFAPSVPLVDANGTPVRICGKRVNNSAKFCSKCGAPAPGGWWRCGGCGKHIGNESKTCPHCGREQNTQLRSDLANGVWQKQEDTFAERFELPDIEPLIGNGLNIQESQCAIVLQGGAVVETLSAGFYKKPAIDLKYAAENGTRSLVLVDNSEFTLPVCVEQLRTSDDIVADLHVTLALRFDPENAKEFMCNLMGNSLLLHSDTVTSSIGYDEIAHAVLQTVDSAARNFCNTVTVSELFKNADIRLNLEKHIEQALSRNLSAAGLKFLRLKEVEFESEVFTRLREMSGQVEEKRREIEFMRRADELANEATRREALSEHEMEDYICQLAHEKGIRAELREQELERMRLKWEQEKKRTDLINQKELRDMQDEADWEQKLRQAEREELLQDLHHKEELERRIAAQQNSVEYMLLESQIQNIKLENDMKKTVAEQEAAAGWLKIKQQKAEFNQKQKLEMLDAVKGADIQALLMVEDDPDKRAQLLQLHEQQMQMKMSPELLLAAAAARGNPAAAEALSRMNRDQLEALERSKQENKAIYEQMLQMSERMFSSSLDSLSKNSDTSKPATQIINNK